MSSAVIVGAGLAGLSTALRLKDAGYDVTVLEANDRPGGRAQTITGPENIGPVDVGTQYFHSNYSRALSLIKRCGLADDLFTIKGKTRFFDDRVPSGSFTTGHRIPTIRSGDLMDNLRLLLKGSWLMLRHRIDPYGINTPSPVDRLSAYDVIRDPFEREYNIRSLVAAGALTEPDHSDISLLHVVRLMRIIVMTDYLGLKGGIASLHHALADLVDPLYDRRAISLVMDNGKAVAVETDDGSTHEGAHVVLATPPAITADLLPRDYAEERAFLQSVKQPPAVVVTLFLDEELEPGIWSYMFRPDPLRIVSFCIDASQKNPAARIDNKSILQAWICHPASQSSMGLSDEILSMRVVGELDQHFPGLSGKVIETHVTRHARAIPQNPPGYQGQALKFLQAMNQRPGLHVCGDYLSGGYMECALWSADQVAMHILAGQDNPFIS
ncbi:protoporphyrinogen/coproporphyrinogen oxidase [Coralliovum pocilloporae]|uniref:protoporphyrinogen/coproporphyrinogen oxidase n=1 Tax=Coralliovum pocilloporae TaxID=3066369 RepID=UPI003306BDD0